MQKIHPKVLLRFFIVLNLVLPALFYFASRYLSFYVVCLLALLWAVLSLIILEFYQRYLFKPLETLAKEGKQIRRGNLEKRIPYQQTKDIVEVAKTINRLSDNIKQATDFIKDIEEGNLDAQYEGSDNEKEFKKDKLAQALVSMQAEMQRLEKEEAKRNWANKGQAKFAELLRQTSDMSKLGNTVLSNLIRYLDANQGGVFTIKTQTNSETVLEMVACYAYDRKKFLKKEILIKEDFAEGMIGQVFLEQETVYLKEVPEDYVSITSGLGDATPQFLLLVPLKANEKVEGVLEIASFKVFEKHEIEFVEKIAESMTTTISSVLISEKTQELLEETQVKTKQLQSQEEEMRQNFEELQATQEAMQRKQKELEKANSKMKMSEEVLQKSLKKAKESEKALQEKNKMISTQEKEMRQNFEELHTTQEDMRSKQRALEQINEKMRANEAILKRTLEKARKKELELKEKSELIISQEKEMEENFETIKATQEAMQKKQKELESNKIKLESTSKVLRKADEKMKARERELKKEIEKLSTIISEIPDLVAYKNHEGIYTKCNKAFAKLLDKKPEDIIGRTDYDFFSKEEADTLRKKDKEALDNNKASKTKESITNSEGKKVLLNTSRSPVKLHESEKLGILSVSKNITETKQEQV